MAFCRNCGKEIGEAKFCPECGTPVAGTESKAADSAQAVSPPPKTPNMPPMPGQAWHPPRKKNHGCLITFLVVLGVVLFAGIAFAITMSSVPTSLNSGNEAGKLEIVGDTVAEADQFALYISGTIKNNTNRKYSYAQVTFGVYDKDGNKVDTALDNINNLGPGETWSFKAISTYTGGGSYKLDKITAY